MGSVSIATVTMVKWLSKEAHEAEVWLGDGEHEIRVFCHPCRLHEGDHVIGPLRIFESRELIRSDYHTDAFIRSAEGPYAYKVFARVNDAEKNLLTVGNMKLRLDLPLPGDIRDGDTVEFVCDRIDVLS